MLRWEILLATHNSGQELLSLHEQYTFWIFFSRAQENTQKDFES